MTRAEPQSAFARLSRMVGTRPMRERCELCAADLPGEHRHLMEPVQRKIVCACHACALLFAGKRDGRFRLIPERVRRLDNFQMSEAQWEDLRLPINLAFFVVSTAAARPIAIYPSPAGPTESLLPLEAWHDLESDNPALTALEPDVEAILINRVGTARHHYLVPIDECYKLVGLLRLKWRGLSGGADVWTAIDKFFDGLDARSQV